MAQETDQLLANNAKGEFWLQAQWCTFYSAGIICTLVIYGLLQERIMMIQYGNDFFTISVFLVFCNRIAAVVFAVFMAIYHAEPLAPQAPAWKYLIVSISNFFASTSQYECLKYVSFTVQMLAKSFKMIPVMIWGMVIAQKRYEINDWLIAGAVSFGITTFLMTGPIIAHHSHTSNSIEGIVLLIMFLFFDGLTSTMQEKLFKENTTSKYNQMLYINGLSSIISFITLFASRTLVPAFNFIGIHPIFMWDAIILSASAVGGQYFIVSQVKEFGALAFAATMNVRQVVSILGSYAIYGHTITRSQISGLAIIFLALFWKIVASFCMPATKAQTFVLQEQNKPIKIPCCHVRGAV